MRVGIAFFIIIVLSQFSFANQGFNLSLGFGAGAAKMTGYNDSIDTANTYNSSLGIQSGLKNLNIGLSPEIIFGYDLAMPAGAIGVYIKNNMILLADGGSSVMWENGVIAQSINSDLSVIYTGVGVKVSLFHENLPEFVGFAAADVGLCHYYWNYIAEQTYKEDGENIYNIRKEWQTAVPGVTLEAGLNWWFTDTVGVSARCGYRMAAGKVMVKVTNINGWTGDLQGEDSMDYSGFFGNAGLNFRFEQKKDEPRKPVKGGAFPEIALWLFDEAQELYTEGLYRQAAEKIKQAGDTALGNVEIEALREKIRAALKTENSAEKIKKLIKEADEFRDKKDFKKARVRYSEAYSLDPENKQAKYYLDEFAARAAEEYGRARGLKNNGKLKDALKAADLSYDYGGNDDARELKNSLRLQLKNKKEQDRLFNEGVENYKKGDYKKAVEAWSENVSIDPDDAEAAANLEKARKKLAELDPGSDITAALKAARTAFDIGNMEEAQKKCGYVLRLDEGNTTAARMIEDIKKAVDVGKKEIINKR